MSRRKWYLFIPLVVFFIIGLAVIACGAPSGHGDGFGMKNDYRLKQGKTYKGDRVIMANTIHLESGSTVNGDVTLIGRRADVNATIQGDLVVVTDRLDLGSNAVVNGNLTVCANDFTRSESAQVSGDVKRECNNTRQVSIRNVAQSGVNDWRGSFFLRLGSTFAGALSLGAIAALSTIFFPRPLARMSKAMSEAPVTTGGMGCLTVLVAIGLTGVYVLSLLLVLPLILLPVVILAWIIIGVASLLGWVALSEPFGRTMFRAFGMRAEPPMIAAAIGGVALSLLIRVWSLFWFTGWVTVLASILLSAFGLGAAVLTRLGTRPYPGPGQPTTVVQSRFE